MPQQGACSSELFRVMIVTECSSNFGSPGAWPKAHCLIFLAVSFQFLFVRLETNLLFYDFRFSRVFIFSTSLSFRCAQTEILPTSHLISDSSFRGTASCAMSCMNVFRVLFSSRSCSSSTALSTMMRSEHCACEGGIECSIILMRP